MSTTPGESARILSVGGTRPQFTSTKFFDPASGTAYDSGGAGRFQWWGKPVEGRPVAVLLTLYGEQLEVELEADALNVPAIAALETGDRCVVLYGTGDGSCGEFRPLRGGAS